MLNGHRAYAPTTARGGPPRVHFRLECALAPRAPALTIPVGPAPRPTARPGRPFTDPGSNFLSTTFRRTPTGERRGPVPIRKGCLTGRRLARTADLFLASFRRMPTANAEGWIESEGRVEKVSARRVFRHLQIGTGPRRSPSACSEILKKRRALTIRQRSASEYQRAISRHGEIYDVEELQRRGDGPVARVADV